MTRQSECAVVVVNYGSHALIEENFGSLDFARLNATLYIVDNFHSAAERDAIGRACAAHGWTLVGNEQNVGFGEGVNSGVDAALAHDAESLVIVNPDVAITTDVVSGLVDVIGNGQTAVCPRIDAPSGRPAFVSGDLDLATGAVRTSRLVDMSLPTSWLSGACIALSAELWRATNGFDPDYFMYWEDVDFSQRCRRAGATLVVRQDLAVVHAVGGTQGHQKSPLYTYYNCRNRLLYAANWLTPAQRRLWVKRTPACSYEILLRGRGRRALLSWSHVSAAIRGSLAGLRIVRRASSRGSDDC